MIAMVVLVRAAVPRVRSAVRAGVAWCQPDSELFYDVPPLGVVGDDSPTMRGNCRAIPAR